ncbi:hypothetical protein [Alkaliphilus oremlandii]|nr:hypothetical protein [Alkaliphilus oremlandii]
MKEDKKIEQGLKKDKRCGIYTCIHCVINTCTLDECDMYENGFLQEG